MTSKRPSRRRPVSRHGKQEHGEAPLYQVPGAPDLDMSKWTPETWNAAVMKRLSADAPLGRHIDDSLAAMRLWFDGVDTAAHLSDQQIRAAVVKEPLLSFAAELLTEQHGKPVARPDLERRLQANPRLEALRRLADAVQWELAIRKGKQVIAERERERQQAREEYQRTREEWRRLHEERMQACELRRARNHGPRCGAKTRAGRPCDRKVVLGKTRCPNHGGLSTGPKTPEGKARSLAALRRGRERASPP